MYDDFVSPIHSANPPENLEDPTDIEDALISIKQRKERIDWFKKLKAKRVAQLDAQIKREERNIETIRGAIRGCMQDSKEKLLKFPDIGQVSTRTKRGTWTVEDEEALLEHLKGLGLDEDVTTIKVNINKTKLNKVLNELEKNNNTSDAVSKTEDTIDISIKFEDGENSIGMFTIPEDKQYQAGRETATFVEAESGPGEFDNLEI